MSKKKEKESTMLTLQFLPYMEIEGLPSAKRISKLLKIVKDDKIILMEGKLRTHEEAELIRKTMEEIDQTFKGIEISTIFPEPKNQAFFQKMRSVFINMILGDRKGITVIGPATIVKEIKQDPDKIHVLLQEINSSKRKR